METETAEIIGNFTEFRNSLIEDYKIAKQNWLDYSNQITESDDKDEKVRESLRLIGKMEVISDDIFELEAKQIENQLGKVLVSIGLNYWNTTLQNARAWKEAEIALLDDLRKKGVSYQERIKKINPERIQNVLAVDKGDLTLQDIELKSFESWLEPIYTYDKLKKLGVTKFVEENFSFMFLIKK